MTHPPTTPVHRIAAPRTRGRRTQLAAAALAVAITVACATENPRLGVRADAISGFTTQVQLNEGLGSGPRRCVRSRAGHQLCGWIVTNRSAIWEPLAEELDTPRRINVLCELPDDGSPRAADACTAYARVATSSARMRAFLSGEPEPEDGNVSGADAQRALDDARTVVALSRLVGDIPGQCLPVDPRTQRCEWALNNQSPGFRLVAATLDTKKAVVLTCELPADGTDRSDDGCTVR